MIATPPRLLPGFPRGVLTPVRGLSFMCRHPALWRYAIIPILLNLLITALVLLALIGTAVLISTRIHPWFIERYNASAWGITLEVAAILGLVLAALAGAVICWALLSSLLVSYFYARLARRVEITLGPPGLALSEAPFFQQLADGLRDTLAIIVIALGLLLLSLIPVVGAPLALVLGIYLEGFNLGYQFLDLPMSLRAMSRAEKLARAKQHRPCTIGLGCAVFLLALIPLLGSVLLAGAAAGAVLLHRDFGYDGENC